MSEIGQYQKNMLSTLSTSQLQILLEKVLEQPVKSNPYTAQITRNNPSAIIFLVDQSGSMDDNTFFKGSSMSKASAVALVINELIDSLIARCSRSEGLRDYFEIALIGYGGASHLHANFLWSGPLAGKEFVKISELALNFIDEIEVEEEQIIRGQARKTIRKVKTWINPVSNYKTPMKSALNMAADLLERWIISNNQGDSFPPIVFNITDGAATDAGEEELYLLSDRIKQLHTVDGNVLFFNIHISSQRAEPVIFPAKYDELPVNHYAELLYNMSSSLPVCFNHEIAALKGCDIYPSFVGMAFNANISSLVQILNIGTNTLMNQLRK